MSPSDRKMLIDLSTAVEMLITVAKHQQKDIDVLLRAVAKLTEEREQRWQANFN